MASRSRPRPSPVSNALPILTTQRRAAVTLSRMQSQLRSANVDNFRTIFVIFIIIFEVILFIDDASLLPRTAVIQLLDVRARLIFDALIEIGYFRSIIFVFLQTQIALIQPVHHFLGQRISAL